MRTPDDVAAAYDDHGRELFAVAVRSLGGDHAQAADVVQETFTRAWRGRHGFDPARGSLRAWLHAINRNVVIDHHRAAAARPRLVASDGHRTEPAAADRNLDETIVDREVLGAAIRALPADQRDAIVAIHYEGHSATEHARRVGVPAGTVRSWVHRGMQQLRVDVLEGRAHV